MSDSRTSPRISAGFRIPAQILIGLVTTTLLLSLGGAQLYAAPVSLPALWWAAKTSPLLGRLIFSTLASLTVLAATLLLTDGLIPELPSWVVGIALASITFAIFLKRSSCSLRSHANSRIAS